MKKIIIISLVCMNMLNISMQAQDSLDHERYGKTLNLGAGIGYYGYLSQPLPVGIISYEFDVFRNFTLAPFVGAYSYRNYYYWGDPAMPGDDDSYRQYSYRTIVIPAGLKGTYYFDELLRAHSDWDFYAAASVGFAFRTVIWDDAYYGDKHVYRAARPLYMDAHIGAEYHISRTAGIFLDLSSGVSSFGLAVHF